MKFYKFCLWKAYFDKGYSLMSLPKYVIVLLGFGDLIATQGSRLWLIVLGGVGFALFCFFLGKFWWDYKIVDAEFEVANVVNPFVKEMRKHIRKRNI